MYTPCSSAASITSWPLGTSNSLPLIVTVTVSTAGAVSDTRALPLGYGVGGTGHRDRDRHRRSDVGLELLSEPRHGGRDRGDRRGAERADRGLAGRPSDRGAYVVADVEQEIDIA